MKKKSEALEQIPGGSPSDISSVTISRITFRTVLLKPK